MTQGTVLINRRIQRTNGIGKKGTTVVRELSY
jgi:hypothetical protein